jgi:hypothetical protein
MDDELCLGSIASLESRTPRIEQTLKKAINNSKRYMCFSASAGIDGLAVNGLVLVVEVFTVLFDHFFLILFLQREANYKHDNTDNSENTTKVCQELTSRASATGVHNLSGLEGSLPL